MNDLKWLKLVSVFGISSMFGSCGSVYAVDSKTYIPPKAFEMRDVIYDELDRLWPEIPLFNYVPALTEHESCISLTHSRCWSPTSRLKTNREEGAGLLQVTRTWTEDGKIRFDTLSDMRKQYIHELREVSWDNIYSRPDLQIRMAILHLKKDYTNLYEFDDPEERIKATDGAYNGGRGGVNVARRACGLAKGCNPQIYFEVSAYNNKSKKPLYAGRSASDIFIEHTKDVWGNRLPKYTDQYFNEVYIASRLPEEVVVPIVEEVIEEIEVLEEFVEVVLEEDLTEKENLSEAEECGFFCKLGKFFKGE